MGVGRFVCVALPLVLTIASIIALLVASLSGVVHNSIHMFSIDVTDLSIDPASVNSLVDKLTDSKARSVEVPAIQVRQDAKTSNITAADLGLNNLYEITLWGYCYTDQDDKRHCKKPRFDWASKSLNTTFIEDFGSAAGVKVDLPDEIKDSLKAFREVSKWTEVAFIIALVALALELVVGIFANCSRGVSCLTWLVASIAAFLVCAAAGLATAMAAIVVGAVEGTAKYYGVTGEIDTQFLATIWIAAAFAIASAFFWIFTICCCKPEHRSRSRSANKHQSTDGEKLLPARGYAPLSNEHEMSSGSGFYNPQQPRFDGGYAAHAPRYPSGTGRSDLAYEPYSHRV